MPIYSVECLDESCQAQLDYSGSHKDPLPACPECGKATKRVITSAPSFKLKGDGWAYDGYSTTQRGIDNASDKAEKSADKRRNKTGKVFS